MSEVWQIICHICYISEFIYWEMPVDQGSQILAAKVARQTK
jgi:hypothetical protein